LGDPEQLSAARVSWNFFAVLGVRPAMAAPFLPEEDLPGGKAVCLISHSLVDTGFSRRARTSLDRTLRWMRRRTTIVGRAAARLSVRIAGRGVDIWAPRVFDLNITTPAQIRAGLVS